MKMKRVLVIGIGRFGTTLVEGLWRGRAEVVAIDTDAEAIESVRDRTSHAFVGDATNPRVLDGVGAAQMDATIITFGMAFESTVLCVASLRRMGARYIIARAETQRQGEILQMVGANRVIQVEAEMGERLGRELLTPVAAELLDLADHYHVVPWVAHGDLVGRTLAESQLRKRYELTVLGYRRGTADDPRARLTVPGQDYVIAEGDTLLLVGEDARVTAFFRERSSR